MSESMEQLKKTPLYEVHRTLGGKMVPFAGWEMPVQYTGLMEEHRKVRSGCGIFDVSHMGEIEVRGPGALDAVQRLTTNDASRLIDGQVQYTIVCNERGGAVDDVTLYRFSDERFIFCVNASNRAKVYRWMKEQVGSVAEVADLSDYIGQIALQGPLSLDLLQPLADRELGPLRFYRFLKGSVGDIKTIISRTGYTGEDGFELYCKTEDTEALWQTIMEGREGRIAPVGLGPRDTLRLEMGYPLYGHELDEESTPLDAGLDRFVRLDKGEFIGRESLVRQRRNGTDKRLVGLDLLERGIPREGYPILSEGKPVGRVTSGTFSPSLEKPIAMGYVETPFAQLDGEVEIGIRKRAVKARIVRTPFYKLSSGAASSGKRSKQGSGGKREERSQAEG
ncbi:MAG: glycine cleavage system aminomethyltransferase GcvT [Thermodesulfobacteriota bacterium]